MEELFTLEQNVSIQNQLIKLRSEIIEAISKRALAELRDYRRREPLELWQAVARAYDNWCESILYNDFGRSQRQSREAIKRNLAEGRNPTQIARTPWLIYEVTMAFLDTQPGATYLLERLRFKRIAFRMTSLMVALGELEINNQVNSEQVLASAKLH